MAEISPSKFVQRLKPYRLSERVSLEQDRESILKLDWNEATRTPSTQVKEAILRFLETGNLSCYPELSNNHLLGLIADYTGIDTKQLQFFGGSDQGLEYIARTFLTIDEIVISLSPNYDNFRVYAEAIGARYVEKFFDQPFSTGISNFLASSLSPKLIYLSNPNNPTGVLLSSSAIASIASQFPDSLIVIDEAYYEFAGETSASLLPKFANIVISRTLSKAFGIAGLRFGYVMANESTISNINRIRNPKNINVIAQIAAAAALSDINAMRGYVDEVKGNRHKIVQWLRQKGKRVRDSNANFILVQCDRSREFIASMLDSGVVVRDRSSMPLMEGYVRITIGGDESYEQLLAGLKQSLDLIRDA